MAQAVTVEVGATVRVERLRGEYRVHRLHDDGTVTVWGGLANREAWRTFRQERLRPPPRRAQGPRRRRG